MNVRTLSAMLISIPLSWESAVLADSAQETEEGEPAEPKPSLAEAAQTPTFTEPVEFRRPAIDVSAFEPPSSRAFDAFGVGMFVVSGADLASTEVALAHPGLQEGNPMQGNRSVRILSHIAAPALMYWVTDKLHDRGKRKTALLARIGFNVAYSYIVMHNLRTTSSVSR